MCLTEVNQSSGNNETSGQEFRGCLETLLTKKELKTRVSPWRYKRCLSSNKSIDPQQESTHVHTTQQGLGKVYLSDT